jgi:hypothetical protein
MRRVNAYAVERARFTHAVQHAILGCVSQKRCRTERSAAIALAAFTIACGGGEPAAPAGAEVGTWNLATINGSALPVVVARTQAAQTEVTAGMIVLNADRSFVDVTSTRNVAGTSATVSTDTVRGVYGRVGTRITLEPDTDAPYDLTLGANTLAKADARFTWTYRK